MAITAKLVSELREKTGAGMMDCKRALEETNGDFEKAIDYLRKKGAAVAAKRAEKSVNEGIVITKVSGDNKTAAIIELNCETDFVARSDDFIALTNKLVDFVLQTDHANLDELLNAKVEKFTVKELTDELMGKVGEKIVVSRFAKVKAENGSLIDYIHPGSKLAVLAKFEAPNALTEEFNTIGKDIAMQIAAMRPNAISRDQVEKAVLDKEIEIYKEQARQEGKPEQIAQKVAEGRLNKFFKEACLLEQEFVKDSSKIVGDLLKEYNTKFNNPVTITKFYRFHLGDEKKIMNQIAYKRILLKLSGEDLLGEKKFGIDPKILDFFAREIKDLVKLGIQVGIVIGGGNIFRGVSGKDQGFDQVTGDQMGMLATVINSLALQSALEKEGIFTRLLSAIRIEEIAEPYIRRRAIRHLEKGRVVLFGAGTGHPYFTTDTAAALRAVEIQADVILKGTRVDGIYSADPEKDKKAIKFDEINYFDVFKKGLKVMDLTAITLCRENKLPIIVFKMGVQGNLKKIILGEKIGTFVSDDVLLATE